MKKNEIVPEGEEEDQLEFIEKNVGPTFKD